MIKKLLLFFVLISLQSGLAQNAVLSNNSKVSVLTCGTGPETYAMYGHTGIRIQDASIGIDVVYNYGAFDFSTPNFIGRFVKGDLQYFVTNTNYADFFDSYLADNREILEQELQLDLNQKNELFQQLNASIYSEDKYYTYKFIDRNCTTMVVDKINTTLGKEYIQSKTTDLTYREILYPYMSDFYMKLGIQLIFGAKVDAPASRLFLPYEFNKALSQTKVQEKPIVRTSDTILQVNKTQIPFSFWNSIYSLISLVILLALIGKKWIQICYFGLAGLLGIFFSLVGMYSQHEEILWNYNILLFNPLLLVYAWMVWKGKTKASTLFAKIILGGLTLYVVYMLNKIHLQIVWPLIVLHAYWLSKEVLKK